MNNKKEASDSKPGFHTRNKHQGNYNFDVLQTCYPELKEHIIHNKYGNDTINFFIPEAVKALNKALLIQQYQLDFWDIPEGYLCPPIPGRANYIHHIADVLSRSNKGTIPKGNNILCLDVGVGANCIYPIIGHYEYGWSFIGSDVDITAITSANTIATDNKGLKDTVSIRLQPTPKNILKGIITNDEKIDVVLCNPPFHTSLAAAQKGTLRKLNNLKKEKVTIPVSNFGGTEGELWTTGGEKKFITDLIKESVLFSKSCCWFSSLVSKEAHLDHIYDAFEAAGTTAYQTVNMGHGNKKSRIVFWTFLSVAEEQAWREERWITS